MSLSALSNILYAKCRFGNYTKRDEGVTVTNKEYGKASGVILKSKENLEKW